MADRAVAHSPATAKAQTTSVSRAPESKPESHVVRLQRTLGNHALSNIVQTRLIVGPAGDRYEVEAERVAEQVMGMHPGQEHTAEPADPHVQRACKSCGESPTEDQPQIRRLCTHCEQEEEKARRSPEQLAKPASEAPAPRPVTILEGELRSGGDPIPDPVRHFFESRFSRNFADVRVHTGQTSETYNDTLHSYGFTYGNHIWLGRGQQPEPSLLMAHELAHVVQQHRPPHLHGGRSLGHGLHQDHEPVVRRLGQPYWEPYEQSGELNHGAFLRDVGTAWSSINLFTEAPIPNAQTSTGNEGQLHGYDIKGQADLYKASTTLGAYFRGHGRPVALTQSDVPHTIMQNGTSYAHGTRSAPRVENGALVNSGNAPTEIAIGELKPNDILKRFQGSLQIEGYKAGIELAWREAQDKATRGDGANWTRVSVTPLTGVQPPPKYASPFTGQTPKKLSIKGFLRKPIPPRTRVDGNLAVWESKTKGVWLYAWVPNSTITAANLPRGVNRLAPVLKTKILAPLFESPLQPAKMSKPGPSPATGPAITPDSKPVIRRMEAVAPQKDTFNAERYKQWRTDRATLSTDLEVEEKDPEFKAAEADILANRAQEHLRDSGLNVPDVAGAREPAQIVGKLEFWAGPLANAFGFFRWVFGNAFVKVANFFVTMRDKLRSFLKNLTIPSKGGFLGAALKAVFKGLQLIGGFIIGKVANRVMQSLYTGVGNMIKGLIGPDILDELAVAADRAEQIRREIEQKVTDALDSLLEGIIGVHVKDLEHFQVVLDTLGDIEEIISLVRWGVRVVECLSPPVLGCLWILAESLVDIALKKVAETCWFQKKIRPYLLKIDYLTTELPNKLGDKVVGAIRALLPTSIEGIFADLESGEIKPADNEAVCEDGADHTDYKEDPLHREMEDFYQKIGDDRAKALKLLAEKMGVSGKNAVTAEFLIKLGDEAVKVDPKLLMQYAEQHPALPRAKPADLIGHVQKLNSAVQAWKDGQSQTPGDQPKLDAPAPDPATPPPDGSDAKPHTQQGASQSPSNSSTGPHPGGGTPIVDANTRKTENTPGEAVHGGALVVANPSSRHTKGDKPLINVRVYWNGEPVVVMEGVKTEVITNSTFDPPTARSLDAASALVIHYHPLQSYNIKEIAEVPDAMIPTRDQLGHPFILHGRILTSIGRKQLDDANAAQAARNGPNK